MFNNIQYDSQYHNDENKKKFYDMYKKECIEKSESNLKEEKEFYQLIDSRLNLGYNHNYYNNSYNNINNYIELYVAFLNFNSHYERNKQFRVNDTRLPYGINNYQFDIISFQILDYNIGYFENINIWEEHCNNVRKTLKFIEDKELKISEDIKNLNEDMEKLDKLIRDFLSIMSEKKLKKIDKLENKMKKLKLKNFNYRIYVVNSITTNPFYLYNFVNNLKNQNIKNNKILKKTQDNYNKAKDDMNKLKDFYLTISGVVIGLIALIIGNLELSNKKFPLPYLLIFNISVIQLLLLFFWLFKDIMEKDEKVPNNKKIPNIKFLILYIVIIVVQFIYYFILKDIMKL